MRELNRIADCRNYKKYDFDKSTKGGALRLRGRACCK
jgi:hypothetical protein